MLAGRLKLPGTSIASLKKHAELIPLFGVVSFACVLASGYLFRISTRNPEVSWRNKNDATRNDNIPQSYSYVGLFNPYPASNPKYKFLPERPNMD